MRWTPEEKSEILEFIRLYGPLYCWARYVVYGKTYKARTYAAYHNQLAKFVRAGEISQREATLIWQKNFAARHAERRQQIIKEREQGAGPKPRMRGFKPRFESRSKIVVKIWYNP